jgi:hypothetical protein
MASFFNPGNPRYRRGTVIVSTFLMTFVGTHVVMGDFGSQKHVFSDVQAWIIPRVDAAFGVTMEEIQSYVEPPKDKTEQWIRLKKVTPGEESADAGSSKGSAKAS